MVYVKSLNKNILPYYLPPFEDELFSSWFCRLSINHGLKPQSFILNYLGKDFPFWNRDIDLLSPSVLIKFIQKHTPLEIKSIEKMFLSSYESFAFENKNHNGYNENILSLGIFHRKRKLAGLLCCPSCLYNNHYYKKEWRLITSIICLKCNEYLIDKCKNCTTPITFHRLYIDNNSSVMEYKPIYLCSNCNADLSTQNEELKPKKLEIEYQRYINRTILKGWNNHTPYSFTYIRVILHLSQQICSSKKNNRFRSILVNNDTQHFLLLNDLPIQFWGVNERRNILPYIYYLLIDLNKFKNLLIEGNIKISYLDQEKRLPFWCKKLLDY